MSIVSENPKIIKKLKKPQTPHKKYCHRTLLIKSKPPPNTMDNPDQNSSSNGATASNTPPQACLDPKFPLVVGQNNAQTEALLGLLLKCLYQPVTNQFIYNYGMKASVKENFFNRVKEGDHDCDELKSSCLTHKSPDSLFSAITGQATVREKTIGRCIRTLSTHSNLCYLLIFELIYH